MPNRPKQLLPIKTQWNRSPEQGITYLHPRYLKASKMSFVTEKIKRFMAAEDGPTTVEYAVLLALMVGLMMSALLYVSEQAHGVSNDVVTGLDDALDY